MGTDAELLERWRSGDREAGNELFERHFHSICRFFENKISGDIEELVQSTFLACIDGRDKFRGQSSFRTYLFSIARYQLYGYFRRNQRDGKMLDFGATSLLDMNTSPHSKAARGQQHQQLLRALCTLPLEQQILLELHYWEGMNAEQLAEVFEIKQATVRSRLFRARQALGEEMQKLANSPNIAQMSIEDFDAWARKLELARSEGSGD